MGNISSRVGNKVTKPVRDYNIHERAHKAVLKNKNVVSPKHPSTLDHITKTRQSECLFHLLDMQLKNERGSHFFLYTGYI